jgi:hypothetical protein
VTVIYVEQEPELVHLASGAVRLIVADEVEVQFRTEAHFERWQESIDRQLMAGAR